MTKYHHALPLDAHDCAYLNGLDHEQPRLEPGWAWIDQYPTPYGFGYFVTPFAEPLQTRFYQIQMGDTIQ